ncbi:MAG TPA: helix-turn-helix domain-containing protein [Nitrospinota bacterium]|nr:helix-turn-helix domain-containing protein [Nitrospinota bacterium]
MSKKASASKSQTEIIPDKINKAAERVIRSRTRDMLIEDWLGKKIKKYVSKLNGYEGNLYDLVLLGIEKPLIKIVLDEVKGNQVQASCILGINRNTLRKKINQYGIKVKK